MLLLRHRLPHCKRNSNHHTQKYLRLVLISDLHFHHACRKHVQLSRGGFGEIDDTTGYKRSTVIDAHFYRFTIYEVGHFYLGAKRKFFMRCGKFGRLEDLTIGRLPAVVTFGVVRGKTGFFTACTGTGFPVARNGATGKEYQDKTVLQHGTKLSAVGLE